ncbi:MAG: L-2-amino-thiazoline-4-carboxylic acid hydrolase [Proteobacteria bacterium]|nr:L-2-amino-thiazoline-4-carboxylic acid hydrolase [Pseudomonadota bacterium]
MSIQAVDEVDQLTKREIQAPLAACLIREFADHLGFKEALSIATKAVKKDAKKTGEIMADQYGDTIDDLFCIVKEVWSSGGAIDFEIIERTKNTLRFNVVRCSYVDLYDKLGLRDFGFCLSCSRDASFAEGFNPKIKFKRSQTIMQGASFCDLCFTFL